MKRTYMITLLLFFCSIGSFAQNALFDLDITLFRDFL